MCMYKTSLVQPNFGQGYSDAVSYWLPHSVACVYTYTALDPNYADQFILNRIVYQRENITECALDMGFDDIVLFSNYMWNWQYNCALAAELKRINPMFA